MSRTVVTETQSGATVPNLPLIGGYVGGGMIATAWYPDKGQAAQQGLRRAGFQIGARTMFNVFREFRPEMKRMFGRR
jgi:hypothetical protein